MKKKIMLSTYVLPAPRTVRMVLIRMSGRSRLIVPILSLILLIGTTTLAAGCGRTLSPSDGAGTVSPESSTEVRSADPTATASMTDPAKPAATDAATPEPTRSGTKFPDFSMKDLDGKTVDQRLFADKDLTVVNIWGTFCPPCIDEMPDLGKLAKVMESDYNAQLVGIVVDISDEDTLALAKEILSQSDALHLNLIPDEAVTEFLQQFEYVPTTLFVDKEGYIVSQPVVGGHSYGDYLVMVKDLLKQ